MKKILLFLFVLIIASAFTFSIFSVSAAQNVIFIADGGNGDGSSASSPLKATTGNYNSSDPILDYHLDSALYQAADMLKSTGGTIVICGEVKLGIDNTRGNGDQSRDFIFPTHGNVKINITSFYNGVDYRKTSNARLILENPACIQLGGHTVFKNITIAAKGYDDSHLASGRVIAANGYQLSMDVGITTQVLNFLGEKVYNPTPDKYPSLCGGNRYSAINRSADITIKSGTYYNVAAGTMGIGDTADGKLTGNAKIKIYDGVFFGDISGTSMDNPTQAGKGGTVTGDSQITIEGGLFYGSIIACSKRGFASSASSFTLVIKDGLFKKSGFKFYASYYTDGVLENLPYTSLIDLSSYPHERYISCDMENSYFLSSQNSIFGFDSEVDPSVIFIADNATGDGSSPSSPLKTEVRSTSSGSGYMNSVLYQAAQKLSSTGGTIVICGEVMLDERHGNNTSVTTTDFIMPSSYKQITITSVYGGVDYRSTNSARLILKAPINMILSGETKFESMNICTMTSSSQTATRTISADGYEVVFGNGISCIPLNASKTPEASPDASRYPSLAGGHRYQNVSYNTNLTVLSGTYYNIAGADIGIGIAGYNKMIGDVQLTVGGSATILGTLSGTSLTTSSNASDASHTGNVSINITGGTFSGNIYACGKSGFSSSDYYANITVTGGNFNSLSSFKNIYASNYNHAPLVSEIDFSEYPLTSSIYSKCGGFTSIIVPSSAISSVSLASPPSKTEFFTGEYYDATGLKINATLFNVYPRQITYSRADSLFSFSHGGDSPLAQGDSAVTVFYGGKACGTFPISVSQYHTPITALGAMIKTNDENQGLRFTAKIAKSDEYDINNINYGFLVIPSNFLSQEDKLDFEYMNGMTDIDKSGYILRSELSSSYYESIYNTDDYIIFGAVFDNIKIQDYKTPYSAVAYMSYEKNGEQIYAYSDVIERSIYGTALAACDDDSKETDELKNFLRLNVIDKADAGVKSLYDASTAYIKAGQILNYMVKMSEVVWSPSVDIDFSSHNSVTGTTVYKTDRVYHGLPYTGGLGDFENFAFSVINGIYQVPANYTWSTIRGNVCSTAPLAGWARYTNSITSTRGTRDMVPGRNLGFYAVGEYAWEGLSDNPTVDIINASASTNSERLQVIYRAYSMLDIGDSVVSRWASSSEILGHILLVAEAPKIVYNPNGSINPTQSTIKLSEQTSTVSNRGTYWSNWNIAKEFKLSDLVSLDSQTNSKKYIPVTTAEFLNGYLSPYSGVLKNKNNSSDILSGLKGVIISNYDICQISVKITNASSATVYSNDKYLNSIRRFDISSLAGSGVFSSLPSGSYNIKVEANLNGEFQTFLNLAFSK